MSAASGESPCPSCGEPVPLTVETGETADQLAAERIACPSCGASLERDVEAHADRGWRLAEEHD